jgi:hypothetical protein
LENRRGHTARRPPLERASRLMPNLEGELIPRASHDISVGQHDIVDKRILDFLEPIAKPD